MDEMSPMNQSSEFQDEQGNIILKTKYSKLYQKKNYLTDLEIIQNHIYEYDIKAANVSVMRASGKIKGETLDKLSLLPKHERNVKVGLMIGKDKSIQKIVSDGIIKAKRNLFIANQIKDHEVLSIKNDAVFIIGRKLRQCEFGPVVFSPKNSYCLYIKLNGIEFYYDGKERRVDVKGVNDEVVVSDDHQNGMVQFFITVFDFINLGRKQELRNYLIDFSNRYKSRELPYQYYREFNKADIYRTVYSIADFEYNLLFTNDESKDILNIAYNYNRFVLPLIQKYI